MEHPVAFSVRFYDWARFNKTNARIKRAGGLLNHVSVGLVDGHGYEEEFVVDWGSASIRPSEAVERLYNEPVHRYEFVLRPIYNYKLEQGGVTTIPLYDPWAYRLPMYRDAVAAHKTSSTLYHYLWWYSFGLLREPTNCVTLTRRILNNITGDNVVGRERFTGKDVMQLHDQVRAYSEL
ncbi:MAG: hypothetical protein GY871_03485 [Actinomycetales bacterium]|nr:hypothetical protein [Actinomycetales bacterium]